MKDKFVVPESVSKHLFESNLGTENVKTEVYKIFKFIIHRDKIKKFKEVESKWSI